MTLSSFTYAAAGVLVAPAMVILLSSPGQADVPTSCRGHAATIVGTPGRDDLQGTEGDDVIVGGHGADEIHGRGGDDVICGNGGHDSMYGGDGKDRLYGQAGSAFLSGGQGDDLLATGVGGSTDVVGEAGDDTLVSWSGFVSFDFSDAPGGVTLDLAAGTGSGWWGHDTYLLHRLRFTEIRGSVYADKIIGSWQHDSIWGGGGSDTIDGSGGRDIVIADAGMVSGGDGDDVLRGVYESLEVEVPRSIASYDGGPGDDTIYPGIAGTASGGPGDDSIQVWIHSAPPLVSDLTSDLALQGGEGQDEFRFVENSYGQHGAYQHVIFDMAAGTFDADSLHMAAAGFEKFWATSEVGTRTVSTAYDITGTDGADQILFGSPDWFTMTDGTVVVHGGGGDDVIQGSGADDALTGGPGTDEANSYAGNDTCESIELPTNCEVLLP
jgi:Ca2+-binding RTX toxin-like protein